MFTDRQRLSNSPYHQNTLEKLAGILKSQVCGGDEVFIKDGRLYGVSDKSYTSKPNKGLTSQRGEHSPPPPLTNMPQIVWHSEG